MKSNLILTKYNSNPCIYVPVKFVQHLHKHEIVGIRFLYDNLFNKHFNVLLNIESDMNGTRQILGLLLATKLTKPVLILCSNDSLQKWYYEFVSHSRFNVALPLELTENDSNDADVILTTPDQLQYVKQLDTNEFEYFIVDDLDLLIKCRYVKTMNSLFRIGITKRNFVLEPNEDLQWELMKWTNPKMIEDKETFKKSYDLRTSKLLQFYPDYWLRLTWYIFENEKPTRIEISKYERDVNEYWEESDKKKYVKSTNKTITRTTETNPRQTRKRKLNNKRAECDQKQLKNVKSQTKRTYTKQRKTNIRKTIKHSSDSETNSDNGTVKKKITTNKTKIQNNSDSETDFGTKIAEMQISRSKRKTQMIQESSESETDKIGATTKNKMKKPIIEDNSDSETDCDAETITKSEKETTGTKTRSQVTRNGSSDSETDCDINTITSQSEKEMNHSNEILDSFLDISTNENKQQNEIKETEKKYENNDKNNILDTFLNSPTFNKCDKKSNAPQGEDNDDDSCSILDKLLL